MPLNLDPENSLPTPANYATPEQLKSVREYAKALMSGSGQQQVRHPLMGIGNMVSALVGGNMLYNTAQQEKAGMADFANAQRQDIPRQNFPAAPVGPPQVAPPRSFSEGPSSADQTKTADASGFTSNERAIASIESGGEKDPWHAKGPIITNPRSDYFGDRAYGYTQVMGKNIPVWTKEVLGKEMTPQEFMDNPDAQRAVFQAKFKNPTQWFGKGRSDGYMTGDAYRQKFAANGGTPVSQGPATAMGFSGTPEEAPATQAIQLAASNKPAPVPPNYRPDPQGGQSPGVDPRLIKPQPGYTPQELQAVMQHPWATVEQRQAAYEEMKARGQPIKVPSPTGVGYYLVDPNNPSVQQYFAAPPTMVKEQIKDIHSEKPMTYDRSGRPVIMSPQRLPPGAVPGAGPRSEADPVQSPAVAPQGNPQPGAGPVQASLQSAPAATTGIAGPPPKPAQVASLDQTAGAGPAAMKPINVVGPNGIPEGAIPRPAAAEPLARLAQAAPPGVDPEQWESLKAQNALELEQAAKVETAKKGAELATKKYDDVAKNAELSKKGLAAVHRMQAALDNENMHFGLAHEAKDTLLRAQDMWNGTSKNEPNEVYDKGASELVLDELKPVLQGTGQVRVAEIELLGAANANRRMSKEANRAVLAATEKALQYSAEMGELAAQYRSGQDVKDPRTGKTLLKAGQGQRNGLDAGFDQLMKGYSDAHPLFTPEEREKYKTDLGMTGEKKAEGAKGSYPIPEPRHIQELKGDPSFRDSFEKHFGPGSAAKALGGQ